MVMNKKLKTCFIICPIGEPSSKERERSDSLLKHVYTPVLKKYGYKSVRADQIPKTGLITTQIINLVIESPLVIADLTGGNPNVFYELAIRHATGLPYIQIIEKDDPLPFDTSGVRTIVIDSRSLDSVEECRLEIERYIEHFKEGHKADSPISVAANVRLLKSDEKYAETLLEKIEQIQGGGWSSIDDLDDKLDRVEDKLSDIERKIDGVESKLDESS